MKIEFFNDYHKTKTYAVSNQQVGKDIWLLSHSQLKRIKENLCGVNGCGCGGIRGAQEWHPIDKISFGITYKKKEKK